MTLAVVTPRQRFTLMCVPMHTLSPRYRCVKELLEYARSKVKIRNCYLDRGFNSSQIINIFKEMKINFLMPQTKNVRIKKLIEKYADSKAVIINDYEMGNERLTEISTSNLILVDNQEGVKMAFVTNLKVPPEKAHTLFGLYKARWGIETSYRLIANDFRPKTTSKNYIIRLFYFLFSISLFNLWILINMLISKNKPDEENIISAKLFGMSLYYMSLNSE